MAEQLEHWTCNSEAPSSSAALTANWICSRYSRVQILFTVQQPRFQVFFCLIYCIEVVTHSMYDNVYLSAG